MSNQQFQYALVARGSTPLAEYSLVTGNSRSVAVKMLENIDPKSPRAIVEQGQHVFMTLTDQDRITFLVLTDKTVAQGNRISFLNDLKNKWRARYGNSANGFGANSKNSEFGQTEIAALLRNYNSNQFAKLGQIKQNLEDTKEVMTQNLTMALARGEQLSVMEAKAENIKDSAATFHRQATNVRRQMCMQRAKWYIIGIVVVLVVIAIIVIVVVSQKDEEASPSPEANRLLSSAVTQAITSFMRRLQ